MTPTQVLEKWVKAFNAIDIDGLAELYSDKAINHQVANEPVVGRQAIVQMFKDEFGKAKMVCIPENIFQDGDWAILEWKDRSGLQRMWFFSYFK